MPDQNVGPLGRSRFVNRSETGKAQEKKLSLSDLMLQTMLDRSDILDSQIRTQAAVVKSQSDRIKQLNNIYSKLANHKTHTAAVGRPTWSVDHDKTPKEILLDNGYKLVLHGKDQSWSMIDANGNETKVWGDPHISEGDQHGNWDVQSDCTFILGDGTKIHVKTADNRGRTDGNVYTDSLVITKGNQSLTVTGIADDDPQIGQPSLDGAMLDKTTNDGHVFKMGDQIDDWVYEEREVQAGARITGDRQYEESSGISASSDVYNQLLTPSDVQLLESLGVTIYDASGAGMLTPSEIQNLQTQIKDMRDSVAGISNIDLTKLDSYNKKYTQSLDLASTFMKSQYEQAKSIIRNIQ